LRRPEKFWSGRGPPRKNEACMKKAMTVGMVGVFLFLSYPLKAASPTKSPGTKPASRPSVALANPASENCIQQGGVLLIKKRGDGAEYGVCIFQDDRQCEEWALFHGECRKGGARVTGYNKQEQIYCALLGGTNSDAHDVCVFKDGSICEDLELFNGKCQKGDKREEIMRGPFH
jgi:uncharacterized protein